MGTTSVPESQERLGPAARALLALLRPADGSALAASVRDLSPRVLEETLALALRHGVAALLHRALQAGGALDELPQQLRSDLEQERRATALNILRMYGQFRRIAQALRARDIPAIALKGLHLAELVYRDISLRPMSDLDILVPQSRVKQAVAALLALDFELNRGPANAHDVGLVHRSTGMLLEVHWTLAEPSEAYSPPIDDIWRLAVPARLGGADAQVMAPEYLLLHVCAHAAYHHVFALDLRALCDIAEIAQAYPELDWKAVVDLGRRHGWGRGVAAALRLARDHVGAAVPPDALAAIGGDTLDSKLLDDALEQLVTFSGFSAELRFAPNLMALTNETSAGAKIATLWKRIFVPRAELRLIYGIPERSAHIGFYYLVRLGDLVRKYAASVRELNVHGHLLAATAARHARLAKWINDT